MKKFINNIYVMRSIFILLFTLLQLNNVVAQQKVVVPNGTQISDNTTAHSLDPLPFSVLDLSSTERGFLMPRLTTDQRNNIPSGKLVAGLTIYNTTMGCVEFYNSTRQVWMNLCGDVEPAVFTIPNDKCQQIKISGDYQQGILLNDRRHLITLEVNVSTPGTFDIDAIAYDSTGKIKNGYTFTTKGVFPTSGNFLIVLKGTGTPLKGYIDKNTKDVIKFWLNKKESTCTVANYVKPDYEQMVLTFACKDPKFPIGIEGKYKIDEPLTSANRIIVPFTVTKPGRGRVYGEIPMSSAQKEVIKYQSETIDFRETLPGEVQWVALSPTADTGKPTTSGNLTGKLVFKSTGKNEYDPTVEPVNQTINGCDFTIKVDRSLAEYSFIDSPLAIATFMAQSPEAFGQKYITPVTDMGSGSNGDFYCVAKVKVTRGGDYEIKTNEENGIWFYRQGVISPNDVGETIEIVLLPYGKSGYDQHGKYSFTAYDTFLGNVGTSPSKTRESESIEFVYRPMKIYGVGSESWFPGGNYTDDQYNGMKYFMDVFVPANFSYFGRVRVDGVELLFKTPDRTSLGNYDDMTGNLSTFYSKLGQADIVMIGSRSATASFDKSNEALQALANFAKAGGTVVYGEGGAKSFRDQITTFGNYLGASLSLGTTNIKSGAVASVYDYASKNHSDLIIEGLFGNLVGKSIAGGYDNATSTNFTSTRGFSSLANYRNVGTFAAIHNSLGVVVVSSSTFMGGYSRTMTTKNRYPMRVSTGGALLTASYDLEVYNSTFLANLLHWAIVSAQEKKGVINK